jgi:hypothetical protein
MRRKLKKSNFVSCAEKSFFAAHVLKNVFSALINGRALAAHASRWVLQIPCLSPMLGRLGHLKGRDFRFGSGTANSSEFCTSTFFQRTDLH